MHDTSQVGERFTPGAVRETENWPANDCGKAKMPEVRDGDFGYSIEITTAIISYFHP